MGVDLEKALMEYIRNPERQKKKKQVYFELPVEVNSQFDSMISELKKCGLTHISKNDLMEIAIKHLIANLELEYSLS